MAVSVFVSMMMRMSMFMIVMMIIIVIMFILQVDIEFYAGDSGFFPARDVEVVAIHAQFFQFVLEPMGVHAQIQQGANEHVAADAAEDVEVESFHTEQRTSNIQHPTPNIQSRPKRKHLMLDVRR